MASNEYLAAVREAAEGEIVTALARTPGLSVTDLAALTGRSRNNVDAHLRRMVADGTLRVVLQRPHGRRRGPPAKLYHLAPPPAL